MRCRDCPYIQKEFNRRMEWYEENKLNGTYDETYGDYSYHNVSDDIEQCCWCDKTGGKVWWYGQCEDATPSVDNNCGYRNYTKNLRGKTPHRNRREQNQKYKNHLEQLSKLKLYPSPCIYTDEIWDKELGYFKNPKPYYRRCYKDNHRGGRYKYYKKYSNSIVRNYRGELPSKGSAYKKLFDYRWTVD